MSAHTPPPWHVMPLHGKYYATTVELSDGNLVNISRGSTQTPSAREDRTSDYDNHYETAEAFANAGLIATAPELYEAAVAMLASHDAEAQRCNFERCGCQGCMTFRPLVAKAEGR